VGLRGNSHIRLGMLAYVSRLGAAKNVRCINTVCSNDMNKKAALFIPLFEKWVRFAFDHSERESICFGTKSRLNIKEVTKLKIKSVYFKQKFNSTLIAKADLIHVSSQQTETERVQDKKDGDETQYPHYYRFRNPRWLKQPIVLTDLQHYKSEKSLRNDAPGVFIIIDPETE
jgi:hypothetical protein